MNSCHKNKLIYQYYRPDRKSRLFVETPFDYPSLSRRSVEKYAQRHGIEYKFMDQECVYSPFYGIFVPFLENWYHEYDSLCFIDSDILIKEKSENIFDYASDSAITVYKKDVQMLERMVEKFDIDDRINFFCVTMQGWANSGVVVFPRESYESVQKILKEMGEYVHDKSEYAYTLGLYDQFIINEIIRQSGKWHDLPEKFNWMPTNDIHSCTEDEAQFIHFHRTSKKDMLKYFSKDEILK